MIYLIAASVPAEIVNISPSESTLFTSMVDDIYCSRWSAAFNKSKILGMPKDFQSQLYINNRSKFHSSSKCRSTPSVGKSFRTIPPVPAPGSPASSPSSSGNYVPSSSPIWGGTFK